MELLVKPCPDPEGGHAPTCFARPPLPWGPPAKQGDQKAGPVQGILRKCALSPEEQQPVQPQGEPGGPEPGQQPGPQGQCLRAQTPLLCREGPSSGLRRPVIRFIVMTAWVYRAPLCRMPSVLLPILLRFREEAGED